MACTTPSQFRALCKSEKHTTDTSGCCPGYAQANLIVLPSKVARDFEDLCLRNPVPCPLLGKTPVGNPYRLDTTVIKDGEFDITKDFPRYNTYEKGKIVKHGTKNITEEFTKDHVGFLLGCSYSFEFGLVKAGLEIQHQKKSCAVAMYITNQSMLYIPILSCFFSYLLIWNLKRCIPQEFSRDVLV